MKGLVCLFLALALLVPAVTMAQIVTVTDRGCLSLPCPPTFITPTSCTTAQFSVPRSGTYLVDSWTACDLQARCDGCMSCVTIYPSAWGTPVVVCDTRTVCQDRQCHNTCRVELREGERYTMQVCLEPCPNGARDCASCGRDCLAGGCVRTAADRPCYPNP